MLQSFSRKTGTSSFFFNSFSSATSSQPRLGAKITLPDSGSTAPGAPRPMPLTCLRLRSHSSTASTTQRAMRSITASGPRSDLVLTLSVPTKSSFESKTPASTLVPPRSTPIRYSLPLLSAMAHPSESGFSGEDGGDLSLQIDVDFVGRPVSIHDGEAVGGLEALEMFGHERLVLQETVEHVARQAEVHAAFPIIERGALGEVALHKFLGGDVEVKDRVGHEGDAVNVLQPFLIHAADEVTGHERVDVAVGQHHQAGAQAGQDDILQLISEVGRIKQAERGMAEDVSVLRLVEFLAHESGALEADLHGGVAAALEPLGQAGNLG